MNEDVKRILLVEDDKNLGFVVKDFLELSGFLVDLKENGMQGLNSFKQQKYDLCILDILLPLKDGFTLAAEIRQLDSHIPIIFLTSKNLCSDKIKGFRIGGDAYITKPFSTDLLLSRIHEILNPELRQEVFAGGQFEIGGYLFDYENSTLVYQGNSTGLSSREKELLKLLCTRKNQLVDKEAVQAVLCGDNYFFMRGNTEAFITSLRRHLQHDTSVAITSIQGMGFMLETGLCQQPGPPADAGMIPE